MMTLCYATKATKFSDITIYFFSINRTLRAVCMYVTTSGISRISEIYYLLFILIVFLGVCADVCARAQYFVRINI